MALYGGCLHLATVFFDGAATPAHQIHRARTATAAVRTGDTGTGW